MGKLNLSLIFLTNTSVLIAKPGSFHGNYLKIYHGLFKKNAYISRSDSLVAVIQFKKSGNDK